MADLRQHRTSLVKGLLGHNAPPQKVVLRGMADLEKTLAKRFQELTNQHVRLARANAPLRDQLLGPLCKDPAWAAYIRRKRRASRKSLPSRRVTLPKTRRRQKDRVLLGSLGGTRVRPFDYRWTWSAKTGSPEISYLGADANFGQLEVKLDTGWSGDAASISARAAVGIFFQSPSECVSKFSFWTNALFYFDWQEYCSLASAHTDGFVGLFAASYDWAGNFSTTLVDQMISFWSNNTWWNNASGVGSGDAFPLSANFQVDPDHWYALWVWCGSHDSCEGDGVFSTSYASSNLLVRVNSISWQVG